MPAALTTTRHTGETRRPPEDEKGSSLRAQVLMAARRRCDDMQDGQPARDQMKREVMETPADLLADLLIALSTVRVLRIDFF
ncbi:hypothetical protein [Comamonas antarctica]|uniref:Uncharacterized protein n=1 Tax=Comamonas antarctica TaxID=2743470 RepID=A0A6N1X4C2_9BURK|nr:hypothetical protein [Comamonas antarctica]QKV52625.1 hypothetical protein HUK68_06750 [Comamonas antarctica]